MPDEATTVAPVSPDSFQVSDDFGQGDEPNESVGSDETSKDPVEADKSQGESETSTPEEDDILGELEKSGVSEDLLGKVRELRSGYLRQADYTRKTQALSEMRKQLTGEAGSVEQPSVTTLAADTELDPLSKLTQIVDERAKNLVNTAIKPMLVDQQLKAVQDEYGEHFDKILPEAQSILAQYPSLTADPANIPLVFKAAAASLLEVVGAAAKETGIKEGARTAKAARSANTAKARAARESGVSPDVAAMSAEEMVQAGLVELARQ